MAFVHPSAEVEDGASIGEHSKVWRFCHVMAGAQIGSHCVLGQNCFVAPGVRIGDRCHIQNNVSVYAGVTLEHDVFVGPSAVFTNVRRPRAAFAQPKSAYTPTLVQHGASIGANATIVCGVTIGQGAFVAAGAVVTRDVPPFALVMGTPARVTGWLCACGQPLQRGARRPRHAQCAACQRIYRASASTGLDLVSESDSACSNSLTTATPSSKPDGTARPSKAHRTNTSSSCRNG